MKISKAGKPGRKPIVARRPQPKLRGAPSRKPAGRSGEPEEAKLPRAPSRAAVMRLAAEVDALASKLEASRARINEL